MPAVRTPADTIRTAIGILSMQLDVSTGDRWYAKPNDVIGGFCITDTNQTPGVSGRPEIADFVNVIDAHLIATLRAAGPAVLASLEAVLAVHENSVPLPFDGDPEIWPIPAHTLRIAEAILSSVQDGQHG